MGILDKIFHRGPNFLPTRARDTTGNAAHVLAGHRGPVTSVGFAMGDNILLTGDKEGNIAERKQAYKHTGEHHEKLAHEKHLNDKAYKVVKDKHDAEATEQKYYEGLEESNQEEFDGKFQETKDKKKISANALEQGDDVDALEQ